MIPGLGKHGRKEGRKKNMQRLYVSSSIEKPKALAADGACAKSRSCASCVDVFLEKFRISNQWPKRAANACRQRKTRHPRTEVGFNRSHMGRRNTSKHQSWPVSREQWIVIYGFVFWAGRLIISGEGRLHQTRTQCIPAVYIERYRRSTTLKQMT